MIIEWVIRIITKPAVLRQLQFTVTFTILTTEPFTPRCTPQPYTLKMKPLQTTASGVTCNHSTTFFFSTPAVHMRGSVS